MKVDLSVLVGKKIVKVQEFSCYFYEEIVIYPQDKEEFDEIIDEFENNIIYVGSDTTERNHTLLQVYISRENIENIRDKEDLPFYEKRSIIKLTFDDGSVNYIVAIGYDLSSEIEVIN